jgi:ferritin-like metal-binding protein YciE
METTLNRTIRYLQDVHAAEKVTEDLLDKLSGDGEAVPEIRLVAGEGATECEKRRETVGARIQALGGQTSGLKDWTNSAMGVLSDIFNSGHDRTDKITMDAIKAHAALHMLHASYSALASFAGYVNDAETASIAERYSRESMMAAERLIPAIDASAKSVMFVAA